MDICALEHSSDSRYCFAIDKNHLKVKIRFKKGDDVDKIFVLWNVFHHIKEKQIEQELDYLCSDDLFTYYETTIYSEDPRFGYIFKIILKDGSCRYYNELGVVSAYDFEFFFCSAFRMPYINESDIVKDNPKFQGDVFYQIFPERFNIGDKKLDKSYVNTAWNSTDLASKEKGKFSKFLGGDLQGIISKLDYIHDLGVDTLYLTPICESSSNHKYDVIDYFKIDSHFGTNDDFKELVDKLHKFGMKIVLDLVFNHSSNKNEMFLDACNLKEESEYYNFYKFLDKPNVAGNLYESFGDSKGMPKLDTNVKEVEDYFVNVGKYFINEFNIDGYRLDVANEVSHSFWRHFKYEMIKIKPEIILIGECRNNASAYLGVDQFESIMNYQFHSASYEFYIDKKINAETFASKLNYLIQRYNENNSRMMLNLLDSHDTFRFYNRLNHNKNRYLLAVLTLISYLGWPMIYYGDEIFMEGDKDPDNRRGMQWDSKEFASKEHELFKDIVKLRKIQAFRSGDIRISNIDELLVIERYINEEKYKVIINNTSNSHKFETEEEIILSNNYKDNILKEDSFIVIKEIE